MKLNVLSEVKYQRIIFHQNKSVINSSYEQPQCGQIQPHFPRLKTQTLLYKAF